jgi:hypothetical protein
MLLNASSLSIGNLHPSKKIKPEHRSLLPKMSREHLFYATARPMQSITVH